MLLGTDRAAVEHAGNSRPFASVSGCGSGWCGPCSDTCSSALRPHVIEVQGERDHLVLLHHVASGHDIFGRRKVQRASLVLGTRFPNACGLGCLAQIIAANLPIGHESSFHGRAAGRFRRNVSGDVTPSFRRSGPYGDGLAVLSREGDLAQRLLVWFPERQAGFKPLAT